MKTPMSVLMLMLGTLSVAAHASDAVVCEAQTTEKKLASAAKTRFLKQCKANNAK